VVTDRLLRFLLIALQSEQEGEAANALAMAKREMAKEKVDARDVLGKTTAVRGEAEIINRLQGEVARLNAIIASLTKPKRTESTSYQQRAEWLLDNADLSTWEEEFCDTVSNWSGVPTAKQREILDRIWGDKGR